MVRAICFDRNKKKRIYIYQVEKNNFKFVQTKNKELELLLDISVESKEQFIEKMSQVALVTKNNFTFSGVKLKEYLSSKCEEMKEKKIIINETNLDVKAFIEFLLK